MEIYDPSSGTFSSAPSLLVARAGHTATLLPNATVLLAGGQTTGGAFTATAENYDPIQNVTVTTGSLGTPASFIPRRYFQAVPF